MTEMKKLVDLIGRVEASGNPNAVFSGIPADLAPEAMTGKRITEMTIGELHKWQMDVRAKGVASTAAGLPQLISKTCGDLLRTGEAKAEDLFDEAGQRAIIMALLVRRGLEDVVSGKMGVERYAEQLSKEWASLPVPRAVRGMFREVQQGESYYADGPVLNKALVSVPEFLGAIREGVGRPASPAEIRQDYATPPPAPKPPEPQKPQKPKAKAVEAEGEGWLDRIEDEVFHGISKLEDIPAEWRKQLEKRALSHLRGKSRTVRDAGRSAGAAGAVAGTGIVGWLMNLVPDQYAGIAETVQDHLPVVLAAGGVVLFILVGRILKHRVSDTLEGRHTGRNG